MPNPEELWDHLAARACRLLEHARELEPRAQVRHFGSVLRLWHHPADGPQTAWTVLAPGKRAEPAATPRVREVVWDQPADHRRLFAAEAGALSDRPTLHLREADLPAGELERLLNAGRELSVPLVRVKGPAGLDGEYFGLETYEVSPSVRVQWWCDGPVEWRHFTGWVAQLRAYLVDRLSQGA